MISIKIDAYDIATVTLELPEAEATALANRLIVAPPAHLRLVEMYDDVAYFDTRARCPWGFLTLAVGRLFAEEARPTSHGICLQISVRRETLDYTTQLKTLDLTTHLTAATVIRTLLAA